MSEPKTEHDFVVILTLDEKTVERIRHVVFELTELYTFDWDDAKMIIIKRAEEDDRT